MSRHEDLLDALAAIDPATLSYQEWVACGMALRKGRWRMTGWVVLFVVLAAAAVSVAAWLAGYAEGMADGTRVLAEWCRRHMDWGDGEDGGE